MTTNKNNAHINYAIRRTSRTTARIAIESSSFIDPTRKQEIWRFFLNGYNRPEMHKGATLGREPGKTCALVIWVSPKDTICLKQQLNGAKNHEWRYYGISSSYDLIPLKLPNRCLNKSEVSKILENMDLREHHQMEVSDDDLVTFFSQRHPQWLQTIADQQINHWQLHKTEKFYRFAPATIVGNNIQCCVKVAPFAALARFQNLMSPNQLAQCISKSPIGAVMFAVDKIDTNIRDTYLIDYAKYALLHSIKELSDADLNLCSSVDMFTAYQIRNLMPSDRRAILLANSYMIAFFENYGRPMDNVDEEIRASIIEYPVQWRASDSGGFPSILNGLKDYAYMDYDPLIIAALFEKAEPEDQRILAEFISARV